MKQDKCDITNNKYVSLKKIDEYLIQNHNHIDDKIVVIDSIEFQKRCHKNAKENNL